jgi:hypothetical protein
MRESPLDNKKRRAPKESPFSVWSNKNSLKIYPPNSKAFLLYQAFFEGELL